MTIGQRIKALRTEYGLYQEDLAKKIGVSRQAIASWERDQTVPSMENAYALSDVFNCNVDDISGKDAKERIRVNNDEEFLLLENFRKADMETRKMVMRLLTMAEKYNESH